MLETLSLAIMNVHVLKNSIPHLLKYQYTNYPNPLIYFLINTQLTHSIKMKNMKNVSRNIHVVAFFWSNVHIHSHMF